MSVLAPAPPRRDIAAFTWAALGTYVDLRIVTNADAMPGSTAVPGSTDMPGSAVVPGSADVPGSAAVPGSFNTPSRAEPPAQAEPLSQADLAPWAEMPTQAERPSQADLAPWAEVPTRAERPSQADLASRTEMPTQAATLARSILDEVDRTCSRFRPDSDLSRANRRTGRWTPVSPVLVAATRVALDAARSTDGLVDPCLGGLLARLGYDRTFAQLAASYDPVAVPRPAPGRWRDLGVDDEHINVPQGAGLDLGATGKAFAADLVAAGLAERQLSGVISVGGDVRVFGEHEWPVDIGSSVADLAQSGPAARVLLPSGGLATSATTARRWVHGGRWQHHVLDPRTAAPAVTPWRSVTVAARTAAAANAASTAAIVLGEQALPWLEARDVAALLIHPDGLLRTAAWQRDVLEAP